MVFISLICHPEQALIEPALIGPTFVSPDQSDRLSLRIEGKGHSLDLPAPRKPKFLHVGVPRALQGVNAGSPQIGAKFGQQFGVCQQFVSKPLNPSFELSIESIVKEDRAGHK
jgi:hypothetical protein